jgi:hypothetical protein
MTENIHIPFKNKMLYSLLIMLVWAISLILPMWKFEPIQYSLLNDKTFTLFKDFAFMQRYTFHLNLVLISGPAFCISAFINTRKLIPLLFGIFIITMFIGGLGFYFSDRVALMWGWYAYGAGVLIINAAIATKLFPGIYDLQVFKNQVIEGQEVELLEEVDEIDEDLMEYKQLEESDEFQTHSDGEEFFLSIYKKLFNEIRSNEEITVKFKEDYLLKTLRKNPQFLDITSETSEEIEKTITLLADELIENALKIVKEQKEIDVSSPSCIIYSDSSPGGPKEVGKFERGIIYSTNRITGKYYRGPTEVGFIQRDIIYSTNAIPGKYNRGTTEVGFIERGIIYSTNRIPGKYNRGPKEVGFIERGIIYSTNSIHGGRTKVGFCETKDGKYVESSACGAAAAYLLLF